MRRRTAIKQATLLAFGMALGKLDSLKAQGGVLTVDLGQWRHVAFSLHGKKIEIRTEDIFKSLEEAL